jgi:hypothetical protein
MMDETATMTNAKNLFTFVGTILAGRTAISRMREARADGDRLELLDALLHAAIVITGVLILVRQLREKDEPA